MNRLEVSVSAVALMATAVLASGCGGSSGGGGSCPGHACGGDVVGSWLATSACVDETAFAKRLLGPYASCPGASVSGVMAMPFGEVAFASDSTYTISIGADVQFNVTLPLSCLPSGSDCPSADFTLGLGVISCNGAQTCACPGVASVNFGTSGDANGAGTYSTSGTMLSLTGTANKSVNDGGAYCVQNDTLYLSLAGTPEIDANLVFTKQ
jgi:hypothetical protein